MPPILFSLLSSNVLLRSQACHALGGLAIGSISLPYTYPRRRISNAILSFLMTSKPAQDPVIIRTLRTTLTATDPQNPAQGPVWALCVLANFIVLSGPFLCISQKLTRIVAALLTLAMRHRKSSVRALGCLVWRSITWVYLLPRLVEPDFSDVEKELYQEVRHPRDQEKEKQWEERREEFWKIVVSVTDMGAGVATIAGLLASDGTPDDDIKRAMVIIKAMIKRGGQTCGDAMELVKQFVTFRSKTTDLQESNLLPVSLFSTVPGLLTVPYGSLASVVRPIFDQCPQLDDIRSLSREEIAKEWVFEGLVEIWRQGLASLEIPDNTETPVRL